ncbi:hypothetical protein ACFX2J_039289 [Malus domestica]
MFSLPFFIIFFLFTIFYPFANGQFTECSQPYDCGLLKNISYPFWEGNNHPRHCDHKGRLRRSTILSALGPSHALTVLFLRTHMRTSQWVTHLENALARIRLTSKF